MVVAKYMTFCDVCIYWIQHNVSFAPTFANDGHVNLFVGSWPIELTMEQAGLRAPVFHGAPGKPDVTTKDVYR